MLIGNGTFIAGRGHTLEGTFTITRREGGLELATSEDFKFDGSPEPAFAFAKGIPSDLADEAFVQTLNETRTLDLPRNTQVEDVHSALLPKNIDIADFDTVVLWCFEFPFLLGYGKIERV